jgi:hypothetical protein
MKTFALAVLFTVLHSAPAFAWDYELSLDFDRASGTVTNSFRKACAVKGRAFDLKLKENYAGGEVRALGEARTVSDTSCTGGEDQHCTTTHEALCQVKFRSTDPEHGFDTGETAKRSLDGQTAEAICGGDLAEIRARRGHLTSWIDTTGLFRKKCHVAYAEVVETQ